MHHPMATLIFAVYIDKHSTFSWEKVNVLAADCEGDVDCGVRTQWISGRGEMSDIHGRRWNKCPDVQSGGTATN